MELEGKKGQDTSMSSESEGYIADDETRPGPTVMQRLKERISDYENHLKGKESSDKEDPHPELSYIPPGDGEEAAVTEGKQHGGSPVAALDKGVSEGAKTHPSGEVVDKPTAVEKIKEKFWETENHMKGKEPSAIEDPHPELAYITPMPQEQKPGFFSRIGQKFGGQEHEKEDTTAPPKAPEVQAANKGVGSNELGTGYEEDGEETINPC